MIPGAQAADREADVKIAELTTELHDLTKEFAGLAAQARISSEREQTAWRERDEMAKGVLDMQKLLQMAVALLAHFAGSAK